MVTYTILMKEGHLWQDITHAVVADKGIPLRIGFSSLRDSQDVGSITLTLHMESLEAAALIGTERRQVRIMADGVPIYEGVTYDSSKVDLRQRSDYVFATVKMRPYSALFSEVLVADDVVWLDKPILTDSVDSLIPSLFHMLNPDMIISTDVRIEKILPIVKLEKGESVEDYLTDVLYQQGLAYYVDVSTIHIVEPYKERGLTASLPITDIVSRPTIDQDAYVDEEKCVVRLPKVEIYQKELVYELNSDRYEDSGQPTQYTTIEAGDHWPKDDSGPTLLDASYRPARETEDIELVHAEGLEIDVVTYTEAGKTNIVTSELEMGVDGATVQLYNPLASFVSLRNIRIIADTAWYYSWQAFYEEKDALGDVDNVDGLYMADSADAKAFLKRFRAEKNAERSTIEFVTHHKLEPNSLVEIEGLPYQLLVRYRTEDRDYYRYSCVAYRVKDVPTTGRVRVASKDGPRDGFSPQAVVLYALGDLEAPFDSYNRVADAGSILADGDYIVGTGSPWSSTPPTPSDGEYIWTITGYYSPPQSWPSSWTTPLRVTGEGAKVIRLVANPSVIKRTFRNEYERPTVIVSAYSQNLSGAISWAVSDGDWTALSSTEIEIDAVSVQGERTVVTASIGEFSFFTVIEVITSGDEEPYNFGGVDYVPDSLPSGASLKEGDYLLWSGATQTIGGIEYKKGEIYEWNGVWYKSENGDLVFTLFDSFADLANDVDSTVIGNAVIKKLVAIDAFIKNLKTLNMVAGLGDGTASSGFRFRAMTDKNMNGTNVPVFDVMYDNATLFKVDPTNGKIYFGDNFWYDPATGAIHSLNNRVMINSDGSLSVSDGVFSGNIVSANGLFNGSIDSPSFSSLPSSGGTPYNISCGSSASSQFNALKDFKNTYSIANGGYPCVLSNDATVSRVSITLPHNSEGDFAFFDASASNPVYKRVGGTYGTFGWSYHSDYSGQSMIATITIGAGDVFKFKNLPDKPSGLASGQVWRDGTTLKIVL